MSSLEERLAGSLELDKDWLAQADQGTWEKLYARIPPAVAARLKARLGFGLDQPRTIQEVVIAALRMYLEAVEPQDQDDEPLTGVDLPSLRARRYML